MNIIFNTNFNLAPKNIIILASFISDALKKG